MFVVSQYSGVKADRHVGFPPAIRMSEFLRVTRATSQALAAGESVCLATVVRSKGSAPRHVGARMLILPGGGTHGTIGGGTLEHEVTKDALRLLSEGHAEMKNYVFDPRGRSESVGLCGGAVDILMEVLRPDPTLLIIGAGHIAQPLAQMAALLDMRVAVVDDTCSTGASLIGAIESSEAAGCNVVKVMCILDRMMGGSAEIRKRGYDFLALLVADGDGVIRPEQL